MVKGGRIKTPSLAEYLLPDRMDFPPVQVILLESGTGVGPFGAKGIGEPSLTPGGARGGQRSQRRTGQARARAADHAGAWYYG